MCQVTALTCVILFGVAVGGCKSNQSVANAKPKFMVVAKCHGPTAQIEAAKILQNMPRLHHVIVVGSDEGEVIADALDASRVRAALSDAVAKEGLDITVVEP